MKIITITDEAKRAIIALCNKAIVLEYDFILNYPRIVDHIQNFEKIQDVPLIKEIEQLGKESLGHFTKVDGIIAALGGETDWEANMLPRLVGIEDILGMQMKKEKEARDLYAECKLIASSNKVNENIGGFFDNLLGRDLSRQNIISYDWIAGEMDRLVADEERHSRMGMDIIAVHKSLLSKKK